MTIALSSPVTGGPQTGFTSPTYTVVADTAPDANSKQWAVTALGGTQAGVTLHSASSPFTFTAQRPATFKQVGVPNPSTGVVYPSGKNVWKLRARHGVTPAASQSPVLSMCNSEISIPAGADTYDGPNVRALMSLFIGCVWQQSAGIGDSLASGLLG